MEIDLVEIIRINSRLGDIKNQMNILLGRINSEIGKINNNINSSELVTANRNVMENIYDLSVVLNTDLPKIEEFIDKQIKEYQGINEDALTALNKLVSLLNGVFSSGGVIKQTVNQFYSVLTPTSEYNMSDLISAVTFFEGKGKQNDNGDYIIYKDTDGSLTAGPGLHISHLGYDVSKYSVGDTISKEVVDAGASKMLGNIRTGIENALKEEKYADLNLNDAQVDSLTSLLYNTGRSPNYFLNKCVEAKANNQTLYEYCTQYWVNGRLPNGEKVKMTGLVNRRRNENVLFEQGYDAFKQLIGK